MHRLKKIAMLLLVFLMIMPNLPQPAHAASAAPAGIKGIGAGYLHSLLIAGDGTVWTMGDNSTGALGNGTTDKAFRPVPVTKFDGTPLGNAKFVTGGGYFSVALLNDGTVWAWGRGAYGKLGNGTSADQYRAVQVTETGGGPLTNVRSIAAAFDHVLAVKEDGSAWGWGSNSSSTLTDYHDISNPRAVRIKASSGSYLNDVKAIGAGDYHSVALLNDGTVWAWGYGGFGALGNGSTADSDYPVQVIDSAGQPLTGIADIQGNRLGGMALKGDGTVWAWGYNENFNLGNPGLTSSNTAIQVQQAGSLPLTNVVRISGGGRLSMALKSDGTLWWWGMQNRNLQVATKLLGDVGQMAAGDNHALVIKTDGTVWGAGWTSRGELGISDASPLVYYTSALQVYPARTQISASPASIDADGTSKTTVTVTLKEGSNYNIGRSEGTVQLSTTAGAIGPVTDHGDGTYTAELTSSRTAGTATITGSINGYPMSASGTVKFNPLGASAVTSTITASPASIPADGSSISTVTVQLKDSNGNPLTASGGVVQMKTTAGTLSGVTDRKNGTYTAQLKAPVSVGTATVTAELGGTPIAQKATVTFTPGAASASASTISLGQNTLTAGSGSTAVTVRLKDAHDNPLVSGGDTVTIHSSHGTAGRVTDHGDGTYTAVLTAGTAAGSGTVSAAVNGAAMQQKAAIQILPAGAFTQTSELSAAPVSIVADGSSKTTLTVRLRDAYGNALTASAGTVSMSTSGGIIGAVSDKGNGTYTATLTSASMTGTAEVSARLNGSLIKQTAVVSFVPGAASADKSSLASASGSLQAGSGTTTLTVKLKDARGNDLVTGGDAVTMQASIGSIGSVADQGNGTYTATLTAPTGTGMSVVSASVNGVRLAQTANVSIVPGPVSLSASTISAANASVPANGTGTTRVTVELKDTHGNRLTASGGTVTLSATAGSLSSVTDHGDGTYSAIWTAPTTAGTATVSGFVNGSALAGKASLNFVAGAASPSATSLSINPASITADGVSTAVITVQAKDAYGNPVTQGGDAVSVETSGGTLSSVTDRGNGTYTATVKAPTTAGKAIVMAELNGKTVTQTADIAFVAGAASSATSLLTAGTSALPADGASTTALTVELKDVHGNNLTSGGDRVSLSTTAGSIGAVTDHGDGTYSAVLTAPTVAGPATITATVNGAKLLQTASADFAPGAASARESMLTAASPAMPADGASTTTVTLQLKDAFGNELKTGGDTVVFTTTSGTLGSVQDHGDGTYSAMLTAGTVSGSAVVSGAVNGVPLEHPVSVDLLAGAASAAESLIETDSKAITVGGSTSTVVTIRLKDAFGNAVTAGGDKVLLQTTAGTLGPATDHHDGTYTSILTAGTAAGEAVITGTVNDVPLAHTASVQFMPGPASADQTILSADRAVVTADGLSRSNVTVQLKDAYGNELRSDAGSLQLKLASTLGLLTEPKYEADGRYTAGVASNTAGTAVITGTLDGIRIASAVTVSFEPGEPSPLASTVDADRTGLTADGMQSAQITVQLKDAAGNTIPDDGGHADIRIHSSIGTVTAAVYEAEGRYTASLNSTQAGIAIITASVDDSELADRAEVEFLPGPASELSADSGAIPANGSAASTITVSVRDAFGNSTGNGADIRLETTLGTVTEATYRENGLYTAEVRSTEPGVADIRAWIGGEPIQAGVQVTFADGLWFTPPSYRLQIGESVRTVVEATYGDAVSDVTPDARIQYDDGLIWVAQAEDGYWYVTGLRTGRTVMQAVYEADAGRLTAVAPVTVYAVPAGLTLDASRYEVREGEYRQIRVTAHYSDGTSSDVTAEAAYRLADGGYASLNAAGRLHGIRSGKTSMTVTYEGLSTAAEVAVLPTAHSGGDPGSGGCLPGDAGGLEPPAGEDRGLTVDLVLDGESGQTITLEHEQLSSGRIVIETKGGTNEWSLLMKPAVVKRLQELGSGVVMEWRTPQGVFVFSLAELGELPPDLSAAFIGLTIRTADDETETRLGELSRKTGASMRLKPFSVSLNAWKPDGTAQPLSDGRLSATFAPSERMLADGRYLTAAYFDEAAGLWKHVPARFPSADNALLTLKASGIYAVLESRRAFTDMSGHWAKADAELLANKLIVQGTEGGRFEPGRSITRAELAAMLVRMLGIHPSGTTAVSASFNDVAGRWFAADVQAAYNPELIQGYADGSFRPDAAVTRQEMIVMIARAMNAAGLGKEAEGASVHYADDARLASWARGAVDQLSQAGLLTGDQASRLAPERAATRAETAAILARMLQSDM
ncbi:invasin domain 3-containing protein [Paenibacillus lautus]|uniref:invasin domain 3-containing protein n=1 Tax=Paenibacillus lautus TaxID=1401 RepID=UPI00398795E8